MAEEMCHVQRRLFFIVHPVAGMRTVACDEIVSLGFLELHVKLFHETLLPTIERDEVADIVWNIIAENSRVVL